MFNVKFRFYDFKVWAIVKTNIDAPFGHIWRLILILNTIFIKEICYKEFLVTLNEITVEGSEFVVPDIRFIF
ncbi:hypothetical protein MC65_022785 [Aeromonas caviae]|nr:hypothetical protein MC65_022785 [Aeromonas caviae]